MRMFNADSSYWSQSELPLTFGLGKLGNVKSVRLQIVWLQRTEGFSRCRQANQFITSSRWKAGYRYLLPIDFATGNKDTRAQR